MACTDIVCGTGTWNGPKPGDPDNNIFITAKGIEDGIRISWSYPHTNPHAVSYFKIKKSTNANIENAYELTVISGNSYIDRIALEDFDTYYYWVQMVSINGTENPNIGPAYAFPADSVEAFVERLSEKIDASKLAQSLRGTIERIVPLEQAFGSEVQQRILEGQSMASAIQTVQTVADSNIASVRTEALTIIEEIDGKVSNIGAQWTAKVDVNGYVGGFGIYNNGQTVDAGFDVDRFWIGKSAPLTTPWVADTLYGTGDRVSNQNTNWISKGPHTSASGNAPPTLPVTSNAWWKMVTKAKPFIVQGDNVFIDNAYIHELSADKIDSKGLVIKDTEGNPIFGVGTDLSWARITGPDKPANGATRNVYRGEWVTDIQYLAGDLTLSNGNGWICTTTHVSTNTNKPPSLSSGISSVWAIYTIKGADGPQGTTGPTGPAGPQGNSLYTWVAYANDATGSSGFTIGANTGQPYIGIANNKASSVESTNSSDYVWSLIKGTDGVPGTPGTDGAPTYTWFAYANNSTGTSGFTTGACTNQTYLGIAPNKATPTESTNPADYTWSLIQGAAGPQGLRGSKTFYVGGQATWSDAVADTAANVEGGTTLNDIVTQYGTNFSQTKFWDGTAWVTITAALDGNLLVNGSIGASKISATSLSSISSDLGNITAGSINVNNKFQFDSTGNVSMSSATTGARMEIKNNVIKVYDSTGALRVRIGDLTA